MYEASQSIRHEAAPFKLKPKLIRRSLEFANARRGYACAQSLE